jgi:hypothetical protein
MLVIEKAIETAALMLGSDRSRGYCLEMIFADFLAGANLDNGDPETLLFSMKSFFKFLPGEQRQAFLGASARNLEKAFGVKMDTLMRMQASYDIAQTRKREKQIHVRRIHRVALVHA